MRANSSAPSYSACIALSSLQPELGIDWEGSDMPGNIHSQVHSLGTAVRLRHGHNSPGCL